ncbi:MAG: hypothetical protein K1X87_12505 [Dehalococcoidia bacterium]|nr:hypothetical protein [Dehalococcoidia bacterium]
MSRWTAIAAFLAVLLAACSDDPSSESTSTPAAGPTTATTVTATAAATATASRAAATSARVYRGYPVKEMSILNDSGERAAASVAEVEAAAPWPIAFPAYVPGQFNVVDTLSAWRVQKSAEGWTGRTLVSLTAATSGASFSVMVIDTLVPIQGTQQPITLNGRPATYSRLTGGNGTPIAITWQMCGRTYNVAALEETVNQSELLRIAESVPERCS